MVKKMFIAACALMLLSCHSARDGQRARQAETLAQLQSQLEKPSLSEQQRYAVLNGIAKNLYASGDYDRMIIFLTDWVEAHPDDSYNAYWLFMVAATYLKDGAEPIAEYYYERILRNYQDLLVDGESIHFACLQRLIQISKSPANRISYFNTLINNFPRNVSITEMYARLALEYEKEGDWNQTLRAYSLFLEQPDSSTIQIPGMPNAYTNARKMVNFSKSPKDWTFESLEALEKAVKNAISDYNWRTLDSYRSKVNFFTMSWKTSESDANAAGDFSMRNFMRGNKIRFNAQLDDSTNANEAYLRTTGWSTYVSVWYFYFRKVNFPADPEIHGQWEWAGIYLGEKL